MTNFISRLSLLLAVVMLSSACVEDNSVKEEPIWDNAVAVIYANVAQLHTKSGIAQMETSQLEQMLSLLIDSNDQNAALIMAIIKDPHASGFALDKPLYIAAGEYGDEINSYDIIFSVEVADAKNVDNLFSKLSDEYEDAKVELNGDKRIISFSNDGMIIGYNDSRLVAIVSHDEMCDLKSVLHKHMKYTAADMSRFEGRDAAMYVDINKAYLKAPEVVDQLNFDEESVDNSYMKYISDNATAIYSISFDDGCITMNVDVEGLSEEATKLFKTANGHSLRMLKPQPIAILNISANGEAFAELANIAIDAAMEAAGGASNEFNIYKGVALGVVASINGDLMFALSDANGAISEDALGDKQLLFTTAEALFTAEVVDDYIMKNIDTYAGPFLKKRGGKYSIEAFGNKISIAQNDNLFYVGVNNDGSAKSVSAANEDWVNNVLGSHIFAMVDINALFKSGFGRTMLTMMRDNRTNRAEKEKLQNIVDSFDSIYLTVNGELDKMHSELMVVANEQSKNSLQTIVELFYNLAS